MEALFKPVVRKILDLVEQQVVQVKDRKNRNLDVSSLIFDIETV